MKKTIAARLVIGALASLAVGGAFAGQITSSSIAIAREAISSDQHVITAPLLSYRFIGDVDARGQEQRFQVQFTLSAGEWDRLPAKEAFQITDSVNNEVQTQYLTVADTTAATVSAASYRVDHVGTSVDKKTLFVTFKVNQSSTALIRQPLISVNVRSNSFDDGAYTADNVTNAQRGTLTKLFTTVVQSLVKDFDEKGICQDQKKMSVSVKHYKNLSAPADLANDTNAFPDEHTRSGATNQGEFIVFPTNVLIQVDKTGITNDIIIAPGGNMTFAKNDSTTPALGTPMHSYVTPTIALLGWFNLKQNNDTGLDAGLYGGYHYNISGFPTTEPVAGLGQLTGVRGIDTAAWKHGYLEVHHTDVKVKSSSGFVAGGRLFLHQSEQCGEVGGVELGTIATNSTDKEITVSIPATSINAAYGDAAWVAADPNNIAGRRPVYLCYEVPGTAQIPSSGFSGIVQLVKATDNTHEFEEQDNICKGPFIGFGGGLKIDVRNYASSKEAANSKYKSVIRLINNSDKRAADVFAQIIHQDGKLGNWGKIADLPARGVKNMTADEIENLLTNAPAAITGNLDNGPGEVQTSALGAPRLRITSESGGTLRVQNYLWNMETNQIYEASGSQGVDYEGANVVRAPLNDGQYISQDAESGLNLNP